tara:strand:+ start:1938 stop:3335 length:1398 start_codon:yes stop_codon:yes gene_type:complete
MLNRFITRIHKYSAKLLANGATRVYVQNKEALKESGFLAGSRITVEHKPAQNRIEVRLDKQGKNKIMDTGRGELFELKNKDTTKTLNGAEFVTLTFRNGVLIITVHAQTAQEIERVKDVLYRLKNNLPLRTGCYFSGLGMLSYHIKQGLKRQGINTQIVFANDNNELAMSCNVEGNPMWDDASDNAMAVVDSIDNLGYYNTNKQDLATVSYPCVGMSLLINPESRDIAHPHCGTLFVSLVAELKRANPAIIVFENTPRFLDSQTLDIIKRSLPGYNFSQTILDGHDYNELESRKRACLVATSVGLNQFDIENVPSLFNEEKTPTVSDFLEPISDDSPLYREMNHVKKRNEMKNVGYRNCVYQGHENAMTTLPASYGSPKAGTPMIAHPTNPQLQRQVQPNEHANLRRIPQRLKDVVMSVWDGSHSLVSSRGSATAAHRLLGNGVSRFVWESLGSALGANLKTNVS